MATMKGSMNISKCSMWSQLWKVVSGNWEDFHTDQGRKRALISSSFYRSATCKAVPVPFMNDFIAKVHPADSLRA